jgi:hypothetical protein
LPIIARFTDEVAAAARAQTGVSELDGMKEVGDIFWAKQSSYALEALV